MITSSIIATFVAQLSPYMGGLGVILQLLTILMVIMQGIIMPVFIFMAARNIGKLEKTIAWIAASNKT